MLALASSEDVTNLLDRDATTIDQRRIPALLDQASAVVRRYTRRTFTREQSTIKIRPIGDKVKLPQRPVISVDSVGIFYNNALLPVAGWSWDGDDEVWLYPEGIVINLPEALGELLQNHTTRAQVTYTHGSDEIPADIVGVVCGMVIRTLNTPGGGAHKSETAGPFSHTFTDAGLGGIVALTKDDRDALNIYRRKGATVELR